MSLLGWWGGQSHQLIYPPVAGESRELAAEELQKPDDTAVNITNDVLLV